MVHILTLTVLSKPNHRRLFKYQEMALHPEIESAVEDICNEAIVYSDLGHSVNLMLDNNDSLSEPIKEKIYSEFGEILRLLDFDNRGYEMFRRWYLSMVRVTITSSSMTKSPRRESKNCEFHDARRFARWLNSRRTRTRRPRPKWSRELREFYIYKERNKQDEASRSRSWSVCYFHTLDSMTQIADEFSVT